MNVQKSNYEPLNDLIAEFIAWVDSRYDQLTREGLQNALRLASQVHAMQVRDDGKPYLLHPVRVTLSLIKELAVWDADVLCVALLHDVLEDAPTLTPDDLNVFGEKVKEGVRTLTKPAAPGLTRADVNRIYFARLLQAPEDCKVVKLTDKLDNLRDVVNSPDPIKRQRTVAEVEDFYLVLAQSLDDAQHAGKLVGLLNTAIGSLDFKGGSAAKD